MIFQKKNPCVLLDSFARKLLLAIKLGATRLGGFLRDRQFDTRQVSFVLVHDSRLHFKDLLAMIVLVNLTLEHQFSGTPARRQFQGNIAGVMTSNPGTIVQAFRFRSNVNLEPIISIEFPSAIDSQRFGSRKITRFGLLCGGDCGG